MGSSRTRMAVCCGGSAGGLRAGARWREGRIGGSCCVTSSGVLCCATSGGRLRSAWLRSAWLRLVEVRRARCRLMPRCAGGILAFVVALSAAMLGALLLKICTITACMACCTGQYRLTTHSKSTCKANTPSSTAGRLRSVGASGLKMNLKVTV